MSFGSSYDTRRTVEGRKKTAFSRIGKRKRFEKSRMRRRTASNKTAANTRARYREGERPRKEEAGKEAKMKKSLMPCERRDPSSVTPDEPAGDDAVKGGICQTSGYIHSSPKKASRAKPGRRLCRSVNGRTSLADSSFPDCGQAEESRLTRSRERNSSRIPRV